MASASSVSRRLLVSVAVPLALFLALSVILLDAIYGRLNAASLRARLDEQLSEIVAAADVGDQGQLLVHFSDPASPLVVPGSGRYAAVRARGGQVLWRSPSLTGVSLDFGPTLSEGQNRQSAISLANGQQLALLTRALRWDVAPGDTRELNVSVAQNSRVWLRQRARFRRQLAIWFALMGAALLATLAWRMHRALEPVRRLEREIGAVESGARAELGEDYPRELVGVTRNLNLLLRGERSRIARYRDTLGNLAHSLKTPLAVIRSAAGPDAGALIGEQTELMRQIIEHQLRRAATRGPAPLGQASIAVAPLLEELRLALLKVYAAKDLRIELQGAAELQFAGDRGDLLELLGNLLDNACKWCRARVRVSAERTGVAGAGLRLTVEDDGEGIASADRQRVLQRGERADERIAGHGLGLAMVHDTVSLYGGELRLGSSAELGGAAIGVDLPGG